MNFAFAAPIGSRYGPSYGPIEATATYDITQIEGFWRDFQTSAVCHVFQTFDFIANWSRHVAPTLDITPVFVTGRSHTGELVYLLPLGIRRTIVGRTVCWLGGEQADYHGGLFDPLFLAHISGDRAALRQFLDDAIEAAGGANLVNFVRMPAKFGGMENPFLSLPFHRNANGAHATELESDWSTYYKAKRGSGWRRTDRKKARQLSENGDVSLVIARDRKMAERFLEALFVQKRDGLARTGVADMFAPQGVKDFYRSLALDSIPERGPVQLAALLCGDRITAISYGLIHADTYYYVLHSYDLGELAEYSPGRQLMYLLMQWCFDNGIGQFDFTIGDEPYKAQWCENEMELFNTALPLSALSATAAGAIRIRESAKRQIKNDPALWAMAVRARRTIHALL
jgi:CelD/BcsL family acetyltransferase involved in cellulose biosynthesis